MSNDIKPLVSVCIPTYQHVAYIRQCLDSVLSQQASFSFEIIIGEDDSTDGTRDICKEYADRHPDQIRLFLRKEADKVIINGNKTGRYNIIQNFSEARGKYIAMLDGDDYWCDRQKLQKQVDFLEAHPDHALCFHRTYKNIGGIEDLSHTLFKKWDEPRTLSLRDLAAGEYFILTCSCMYRNGMYSELPSWFWEIPFIDYALHLWNAQFGKVGFLPDSMAFYRIHPESMWATKPLAFRLQLMIELLHFLIKHYDGDVQTALLQQQRRNYDKLLPFLLEENNEEQLCSLVKRCSAYPNDFQQKWVTKNLLRLHQERGKSPAFQVRKLINKARTMAFGK